MRRCVITGAADGIGKALARLYSSNGFEVVGIDVDVHQSELTESEIKSSGGSISFVIADLAKDEGRECALQYLESGPPCDVFVHNAGINEVGSFTSIPSESDRKIVEVNFLAPMLLTAELLKRNRISTLGSLVFISSLSCFVGYPGATVYSSAKRGLAAYARSVRFTLRRRGIHVLTVYPGPTRTAMGEKCSLDSNPKSERRRMAPDELARRIHRAVERKKSTLIPGAANKVFAAFGHFCPSVTESVMRKLIFEKLRS